MIRFDNREVGLTTNFDNHGVPDMQQIILYLLERKNLRYNVDDIAEDGIALFSAPRIRKTHVGGTSLGGIIMQTMAINHPTRIRPMTSKKPTTANPALQKATLEAISD